MSSRCISRTSLTVSPQITDSKPALWVRLTVGGGIFALVWIVFGQTLWHDFVNYDDKTYVYGNALVSSGVTGRGLERAFVDTYTKNWHPLTIISHMIDCQIFGLKPGGHHFTNVLLHTVASLLLLLFLYFATQRFWCTAFVGAIFAIHPLRVESVAWVAERKDVLSAVFFFLTLIAYGRYVRLKSFGRYAAVLVFFACGLMSKPMLVTTPVVLLLLDYWPLNRGQRSDGKWSGLIIEKIPLFALSLASSIVTFLIQIRSSESIAQLPFSWRLQNAIVTYVTYILQLFWPTHLAVFYPHPDNRLALWQVVIAGVFVIAITWGATVVRKRYPYIIVGWLWYLVMLLPVIGIIEVGLQGHADRYTYLPHVGLYIALTWLIADLSVPIYLRKRILGALGFVVVLIFAVVAWKQTTYWRNSETLWTHTLAVTADNDVALNNLGNYYSEHGRLDEALSCLQRALDIRSRIEHEHYSLSLAIMHATMGEVLTRIGRLDEALDQLRQATELRPDFPDAHYNFGAVLFRKGDIDGAIKEWRATLELYPNDPGTNTGLANALVYKGQYREAVSHYELTLRSEPDSPMALNNLAWILSAGPDQSIRDGRRAVDLAVRLNEVTQRKNPFFIRTLAAAYAEAGEFDKAIETNQAASGLADAQGQHELAAKIQEEGNLYREHRPFHDPTLPNAQ